MSMFTVTLNYHGNYGYVEYDSENKQAEVVLSIPEAKAKVEKFLSEKLTLDVQEGDTVRQFVTKTLEPLASLENFKICLTRLWFNTDVSVEWSMPPGMMENL
ncbi:MAG: hypothetical protein EP149_10200 [Phascolarctobacterium sp.]|nr:hypothetical protein [Phascolarctobacterium sp.]MUU08006.1 hypothetical protein [Phascolarctobacterium sp.]MUU17651.1 hypothetical protein [Phascolarctobacterium sp.]